MNSLNKSVLISGASIAGLSTAWWMNKLGYRVTVVETANGLRTNGAAIDLRGDTIDFVKRMGIFDRLITDRLNVEKIEFKNALDETEGSIDLGDGAEEALEDIEIERDKFINILYSDLGDKVEFLFNNSITALSETDNFVTATFRDGAYRDFELVLGCDGIHSGIRKLWFGHEAEYSHFLQAYFSITTVEKLLVKQKHMQMYNEPDNSIMLNAYKNKTDIIFCFYSDNEIAYNYRDTDQQRQIIMDRFAGMGWRAAELLQEIKNSDNFYFDKFCQIKMPAWSKGRVALIGDAGYCASPAAGMGASLSITGAGTLANALEKHNGDFTPAFAEYNEKLRPFIEEVQATAEENVRNNFIPRTEEAIHIRNTQTQSF